MPDTVRVTFLYALGQQVHYADEPRVYTIRTRTYIERPLLGPLIMYRLEHQGTLHDVYERDVHEPYIVPLKEGEA